MKKKPLFIIGLLIGVIVVCTVAVLWQRSNLGGLLSTGKVSTAEADNEGNVDKSDDTSGTSEADAVSDTASTAKDSTGTSDSDKEAAADNVNNAPIETGNAENTKTGTSTNNTSADNTDTTAATPSAIETAAQASTEAAITAESKEQGAWKRMHQMSNTKIIADEIWGKIDITAEKLDELISEVEESEYDTREMLLEILYRWKEGDFRKAVQDHNYVWRLLEGTVGKATALNDETAKAMAAKYPGE